MHTYRLHGLEGAVSRLSNSHERSLWRSIRARGFTRHAIVRSFTSSIGRIRWPKTGINSKYQRAVFVVGTYTAPPRQRNEPLTLDRLFKYGGTTGCDACAKAGGTHSLPSAKHVLTVWSEQTRSPQDTDTKSFRSTACNPNCSAANSSYWSSCRSWENAWSRRRGFEGACCSRSSSV